MVEFVGRFNRTAALFVGFFSCLVAAVDLLLPTALAVISVNVFKFTVKLKLKFAGVSCFVCLFVCLFVFCRLHFGIKYSIY